MKRNTDIDKTVRFLKTLGIIPKVKNENDGRKTIILRVEDNDVAECATTSYKILGYTNCYTEFLFDNQENFVGIGLFQDIGS